MKKILFFIAVLLLNNLFASAQYEETVDFTKTKILKGILSKDIVANDSAFKWFDANLKGYTPNEPGLDAIAKNKSDLSFVVFVGTWCEDSQILLPRFYNLVEQAGIPENKVALVGVSRDKKSLFSLTDVYDVSLVPTFIVLKKGKEIGRVVEFGTMGMFDKEIGTIITNSK